MNRFVVARTLPYIILSLIGMLFLLPLLWLLFASLDQNATLALKLPSAFTLDNYVSTVTNTDNQKSFGNGLILAVGQALLVVVVAGLASYPLSRYQLKYKRSFMYIILFATGLPITAVMVPVYQFFIYFRMQDSLFFTVLFLTASALPYSIWMMKNFMDSVPLELEEAAWVDGASIWTTLRLVIVPLMLPGIFTVGIFAFAGSWGNFLVPFILLQSPDKLPAAVTIYQYFGQNGLVQYGTLASFSIIYTIPAVALYIIGQRYMSQGFSFGGANKG
ncbi:carbohydrate ABC transporter permease [Paenibacillus sp. PsM32]|uniref:Carbohydrate ABC transporter permease n=2 Tax=Paenibacillus TaxID=44249 RepID=A0AAX3M6V3_9BACL|nr:MULTISPECIES: carbohydrate ABC transporter permease [Paenibacillus]MDN4619175.1 carbohydrate ABC transporter permease [Paenibacillus sp. PsM32]WCT58055.1 carbohydrate ABC transporter permease [Paenibacillus kyungheensis]WDF53306.1 carbohydrate ABC transporter permease [Paenibacillus sp. KACC 21273]